MLRLLHCQTAIVDHTTDFSVAHRQILVHAHAVDLYRREYQAKQNGKIGITLNIDWTVPIDESKEAKDAADLAIAMALGWVSRRLASLTRAGRADLGRRLL